MKARLRTRSGDRERDLQCAQGWGYCPRRAQLWARQAEIRQCLRRSQPAGLRLPHGRLSRPACLASRGQCARPCIPFLRAPAVHRRGGKTTALNKVPHRPAINPPNTWNRNAETIANIILRNAGPTPKPPKRTPALAPSVPRGSAYAGNGRHPAAPRSAPRGPAPRPAGPQRAAR